MSANGNAWSRKLALALIICAVAGTEISYHFTLESRFESIEEKLAQQTAAMQQMQESLDSTENSKDATLTGLNKQLTSLQSSFEPLGKTTQTQADALNQLHVQLASLQQAQTDSQDAQKKLSAYITQLEESVRKARSEAAAAAAKPTPHVVPATNPLPAPTTNAASAPAANPAPAAPPTATSDLMGSPGSVSHPPDRTVSEAIAAENLPQLTPPRAIAALDLRPADVTSAVVSPRALPVAGSFAARHSGEATLSR